MFVLIWFVFFAFMLVVLAHTARVLRRRYNESREAIEHYMVGYRMTVYIFGATGLIVAAGLWWLD
jgi:hypothetical protein